MDNDAAGGNANQLSLYLTFEKDFEAPLLAKAYDKNGPETSRDRLLEMKIYPGGPNAQNRI